jgi:sigma-B regulation protein RsbU (phosphoserine phosphatase)
MKTSFGVKLGFILMALITSLVGSMLLYFNQYSTAMLQSDLKQTISDVTRTGAMVFDEADREVIQSLRAKLYKNLPEDYQKKVNVYLANKKQPNRSTALLAKNDSNALHNSNDFQYIVQLLRRIQEGSRARLNTLDVLPQTNVNDADPSRVAWAYLMVTVPNIAAEKAIMFLADSNYEIDHVSPEGNQVGNLFDEGGFFVKPFRGEMGASDGWYEDKFGRVMTALVPIKNDAGEVIAALGVDYNVNMFSERVNKLQATSWTVFGFSILAVFVISVFITIWVSMPLAKLRSGAEQLSKQDFDHVISIRSKDEFGLLANTINKVSHTLGEFTRNLDGLVKQRTQQLSKAQNEVLHLNQQLTEDNAHLGAEVENLIALRKKMMPEINTTIPHHDYDVSFYYLPSQRVGGDFWQLLNNTEQSLEFVIGQTSGYGLETASTTMQIQSLLATSNEELKARVSKVNKFLYQLSDRINLKLFSKVLNVSLDENWLTVTGHLEDPIMFTNSDASKINVSEENLPLGLEPQVDEKAITIELQGNQNVLLYTSGFINALAKLTNDEKPNFTAEDIIKISGFTQSSVEDLIALFKSQPWFDDFEDDICFVLINKRGN